MNFYKRYPGDYIRDTAHLSLMEHGAYTLLLDHCYSTERSLPADPQALFRICRAFSPEEQAAVVSAADQFFPLGDDGLRHNARFIRQLPDEQKGRDVARENGKRGGRPRKPSGFNDENPAGYENETQRGAEKKPSGKAPPTPYPLPHVSKPNGLDKHIAKKVTDSPEEFEQAWREYPNRPGASKQAALKAWKARINDGVKPEEIVEGVKRYARYCEINRTESRFIKHPATFFGPDMHFQADWSATPSIFPASHSQGLGKFDPTRYVNEPDYAAAWDRQKNGQQSNGGDHGIVIDGHAQRMA